jgi:hypothetical protein
MAWPLTIRAVHAPLKSAAMKSNRRAVERRGPGRRQKIEMQSPGGV